MIIRFLVMFFGVFIASTSGAIEELPLDIEADEMVMEVNKKTILFSGSVKVVRGNLTLTSSQLAAKQNPAGELKEIVATGDVFIKKENETATGNIATYLPSTEMLTVSGDVTLQRGGSVLTGDILHYNLKNGTLKLNTNKGKRVRATIAPKDLNK